MFYWRLTIFTRKRETTNRKIKFNIKNPIRNISGGVFGGEPINFDLFLTFYNNWKCC